ncbi:MAG TPA: hypothetical protein ENJ02_07455 [Chloroflexi bacterium]|nr:hypothetical protein [Chloroflexota bacterium]
MPKLKKNRPARGAVRGGMRGGPPANLGRSVRRNAFRKQANAIHSRPRPAVRPAAPPRRVMPRQPVRPALKGRRRRPVPATPPVRRQVPRAGVGGRPGMAAAAAGGLVALNAALAHPELQTSVRMLQSSLEQVRQDASLQSLQEEVTRLNERVNKVVSLLESAREQGYAYQGDMDEIAYQAVAAWQGVYPQVTQEIPRQAAALQARLQTLSTPVAQLNRVLSNPAAARRPLQQVESQVNQLQNEAGLARSALQSRYSDVESQIGSLESRLNKIHWALKQLDEAKFNLERGEDLVMAVRARWDKEGKDDPEGVLYLTNKRLIFERKEKLARKKVLFITVDSELVQEVLIDQPVSAIKEVKAVHKGLFGHQDFLSLRFDAPGLKDVSMHLDGQDSKDWDVLIRKVQSGEIEQERAAATGVSLSDLTKPLTQADLLALQGEVNALQDAMMLKTARVELESLESEVGNLGRELSALRARGYVIEKSLEGDVEILTTQWERVRQNALTVLEQQTGLLGEIMQGIQDDTGRLLGMSANLAAARPLYMQVKSALASAQAQAEAAEETVFAQFDAYDDEVESLAAHFDWVNWMLDALETASFQLAAAESGVAAVEAQWLRPGLEPENGILFLTDQRLLWEDRVDDFELKFDVPLSQVLGVQTEEEDEEETDIIACALDAGAPVAEARFLLGQPVGEAWVQMINRARSGGYVEDRAVKVDETELERIRNAPTVCPTCGAPLSAPILRGQTEIVCEYCNAVIRL